MAGKSSMSKITGCLAVVLFLLSIVATEVTYASEIDILVDKLVEKGILTRDEAQQIITETREETRKKVETGTHEGLPEWIQKIKIKGDFRLRYQGENKESDKADRHRGRYRLRVGVGAKVIDTVKVDFGLASGGDDPRSTNQSMANTFETPDIRINYAQAQWDPIPWLTLKGGKMNGIKNCIGYTSDLLWDSDINPEGASVQLHHKISDVELFLNTGFWILDEWSDDSSDPYMVVVQQGFKYKFGDKAHIRLACAYYSFDEVEGYMLDHSAGTNTLHGGVFKYDYDAINPSIEIGITEPFGESIPVPSLSVFGEYVYNGDPDDEDSGYLAGIKFGSEKVKKAFDWQVKYMYRHLEKDAWLDTFPDSNAYGGKTDVEGHEAILEIGIGKNMTLGLDYYSMERILGDEKNTSLWQVDWVLKL